MAQIVVKNLVKTFSVAERAPGMWGALKGLARRRHRTVTALDGISFTLREGELLGYIGPNGAGKSTTVKILSGILVPDSGRVEVLGKVPWTLPMSVIPSVLYVNHLWRLCRLRLCGLTHQSRRRREP